MWRMYVPTYDVYGVHSNAQARQAAAKSKRRAVGGRHLGTWAPGHLTGPGFWQRCGEMHISNGHVPADEECVYVYIIDDPFSLRHGFTSVATKVGNEGEFLTTAFPRHG